MASTKLSSKYQIVIPKQIRESMGLKPGQVFEVMEFDGVIEIVPVRSIKELRGTLKGMDASGLRDKKDRF